MQLGERCGVTGLCIFSTLVYSLKLFFQRARSSLHSDFQILGKNIEIYLGECYSCKQRLLNTGRVGSHTCHLEAHSHKHSSRGRRGFVVYIIFNKESLEMSGFVAPWLEDKTSPRLTCTVQFMNSTLCGCYCLSHGGMMEAGLRLYFQTTYHRQTPPASVTSLRTRSILFYLFCICNAYMVSVHHRYSIKLYIMGLRVNHFGRYCYMLLKSVSSTFWAPCQTIFLSFSCSVI